MSPPRTVAIVLLVLAVFGGTWLWWSSGDSAPPAPPPTASDTGADLAPGPSGAAADDTDTTSAGIADSARTEVDSAEPTGSEKGVLRVTATWPENDPATGVMIYVRRSQSSMPYTAVAHGMTDDSGVVELSGVPPGKASLLSDRGDRHEITVVAGVQDVGFGLKGGVEVRGTVTGPDGTRVAGAEVWLQTPGTDWSSGRTVTITDGVGAFALQHIDPTHSLGAVAAGFSPSKLVDLDVVETSKRPAIVNLELQPAGGRLEGRVSDSSGEHVAAALVAAGEKPRYLDHRGERIIEQWTTRTAATDGDGCFAIDGLAVGVQPVAIRADGYGLWRGEVEIAAGQTAVIAPQLQASAVLVGTVTDDAGAPLEGAAIRVYDRAPGTSFVAGGQIDFDETFGYRGALSGAAGRYRLDGITPGVVHLFAQGNQKRREGVSVAYTRAELEVQPATEVTWNPVISDGLAIEGVVLYRDGLPMRMVFVTLVDERGGKEHVMTSSEAGEFRFLCLDASTYGVRVQYWDAPKGTPPLQASGIVPDRGRVELRATFDKPVKQENGIVIGRIDDVAGRLRNPKAARVTLQSDQRWFREDGQIVDGAFRFERVTPCRFRLGLMEGSVVIAQSDWFELLPAATLDTGVLRTEPAGSAKIFVTRQPGAEALEPKLYLRADEFIHSTTIELGRRVEVLVDNLTPGEYAVTGYAKGMVSLRGEMTVVVGQTAQLRLTLRAGALCRFSTWWPEGRVSARRKYRVLGTDGTVFHEYESDVGSAPTRPLLTSLYVPVGRWTVEFTTDDGLRGEADFEVENPTDEVPVRIDLK